MCILDDFLDPSQYGVGAAKTWQELQQEIATGESEIRWEDDRPVRIVRAAAIEIIAHTGERLVEDRQVFMDGRVRRRPQRGVSEKLQRHESPEAGAQRALTEELGIEADLPLEAIGSNYTEQYSPSYPGLLTRYHIYRFRLQLPAVYYRSEYVEVQSRKKTFFVWQVPEASENDSA